MAWIKVVEEGEARGRLGRFYEAAVKRSGRVYNILKIQSNSPMALESSMGMYAAIMKGDSPLSRSQREMLAVVVSRANGCHY